MWKLRKRQVSPIDQSHTVDQQKSQYLNLDSMVADLTLWAPDLMILTTQSAAILKKNESLITAWKSVLWHIIQIQV